MTLPGYQLTGRSPSGGVSASQSPMGAGFGATMNIYGAIVPSDFHIGWQYNYNQVVIGGDPVDPLDTAPLTDFEAQVRRRSAIHVSVRRYAGADPGVQHLLVFGIDRDYGWWGNQVISPSVQFFVGSDWVRTETIENYVETVGILMDDPGDPAMSSYFDVVMRLAGPHGARVTLTGIQGYAF
jgi:hypothetical protein